MRSPLSCLTLMLALACGASGAWSTSTGTSTPTQKPGSIVVSPASITYFAQAGDTLMSIALQFTTKRENWLALGKLNHIEKDSNIPIGTGILIPAPLLADEPSEAKVVAMSGTITATAADGSPASIALDAKVTEGMQIDTGNNGFLTMSLPDASRITLPSNSRVKIAKLRMTRYTGSPRTEVLLLQGRVESRITPLEKSKGQFEVRTPLSVAGVRGTHFRVSYSDNKVMNEVLSGSVAVDSTKKPNGRTLDPKTGNVITPQAVGPALPLLPPPQIRPLPDAETTYPAARFELVPLVGATSYHIQISNDEGGQNIIAESRSSDNSVAVAGVKDGTYFMQVSAISKEGLEGLVSTQPFTLKTRSPSAAKGSPASPPYVDHSDDKMVTLRWAAQAGKKYTIQVARDAEFTWLLHTATTDAAETRIARPAFGTYYARVQAVDPNGDTGPFSRPQAFIVTDQWVINEGNPTGAKEARSNPAH